MSNYRYSVSGKESQMKRIEGRIGEPSEFVEFDLGKKSVIAQKSGETWCVYLSYHGKKAPVRTLCNMAGKSQAVWVAEIVALALEKDSQL